MIYKVIAAEHQHIILVANDSGTLSQGREFNQIAKL